MDRRITLQNGTSNRLNQGAGCRDNSLAAVIEPPHRIANGAQTGTAVMLKTVYAIAAAAIVAACLVTFPGLSAQVEARAPVTGAKAERADARPLGTACSQRAWPYFEAACLRDARNPFGQARRVRIVSADRL
jgi:hypothetical protein